MRFRRYFLYAAVALALTGCKEEGFNYFADVSGVRNKVEQPLPSRILSEMQKKDMDPQSPIMIRIFKEEGVLEIWKAKRDMRFEQIASYRICAWSGRLGPKVKEGDRQAPEGFYTLTKANLNPNSKYYLAINTGFPNAYDRANRRTGNNLMIHGACSSSGCYSMTDAQILEIFAFARDAFRGGQREFQLQAFPFRMSAENMARHRNSPHMDFWKMLKVGYDQFEITKRPPEVNVCGNRYVFNEVPQNGASFSPTAACPPMSVPPALAAAMAARDKAYQKDYQDALASLGDKVWYDPSEAERRMVVADIRKGRDLAFAPTGTSLQAGKLVTPAEYAELMSRPEADPHTLQVPPTPAEKASAPTPEHLKAIETRIAAANVPIPTPNPNMPQATASDAPKKPFWMFWSSGE